MAHDIHPNSDKLKFSKRADSYTQNIQLTRLMTQWER